MRSKDSFAPILLLLASLGIFQSSAAEAPRGKFLVETFGASHSTASVICSGNQGERVLRCSGGKGDFEPGQGIMIRAAGPAPVVSPVTEAPIVKPIVKPGTHTYTYVVVAADLLHGMAEASPPVSVSDCAILDGESRVELKTAPSKGPLPVYLWYASEDGGPYRFVLADQHTTAGTPDAGQRPPDGRGWPAQLPNLPLNQDLWSTVTAADRNLLYIADPLPHTVHKTEVLHDDTLAVQAAVDAAKRNGGGTVKFGPYAYNLLRPAFWNGTAWSRSIGDAKAVYPPKIYITGQGDLLFDGEGPATRLINSPDAYTYGALVSFGIEKERPWTLPFTGIRPVPRGANRIEFENGADPPDLRSGSDIWLFSGSFTSSPCPASKGTPGSNCHYSELNSVKEVAKSGAIYLKYPTVNSYRNDGINPLGIVNLTGRTIHRVGFRNLSIAAYGPISTQALVYDFAFDNVTVTVGPTTNWWYGGLNRGWSVRNSILNIGDGGMYFAVENEMDQYSDVHFENNTLIGHSAPKGADRMLAYASVTLDEGSGDVVFENNRLLAIRLRTDNTFNGFKIVKNMFINGGVQLGAGGSDVSIRSFGLPSDVEIASNYFRLDSTFAPARILEVRIPATDVKIRSNTIVSLSEELGSVPLISAAAGEVADNRVTTNTKAGYPIGIQITPKFVLGFPQPGITVARNYILHGAKGVGVEVEDPKVDYEGPISVSDNHIEVAVGPRGVLADQAGRLKNIHTDLAR